MTKNLPLLSPNIKLSHQRGLTLVEILISTLLMAILATTLIFVFRSGQTTWGKTKRGTAIYQNARAALGEMSRGLSGALISDDNVIYFLGADNQVDFVCSLESDEGTQYDLCEIRYYLNAGDKEVMKRLERNPDFDLSGGGSSSDLAFQVTALGFKYWGEATTDWDTDALTSWNSGTGEAQEGKLPRAVKMSITVEEDVAESPISKTFNTVVYLFNSQG